MPNPSRSRGRKRLLALAVFSSCLAITPAHADVIDTTWLGGSGSWNDPTKWSGGVIPNNTANESFRVTVPSGTITTTSTSPVAVAALTLDTGALVNVRYPLSAVSAHVDGRILIDGTMTAAQLSGSGTVSVGNTGTGAIGGTLAGAGGLEIGADVHVAVNKYAAINAGSSGLVNRGHVSGGDNDSWFCPYVTCGSFSNLGTIEPRSGYLIVSYGATVTRADLGNVAWGSSGTLAIAGTLLNQGQTLIADADHRWAAFGTIRGGSLQIAPGSSFQAGSTFNPATFDDVSLSGKLDVRGKLNISGGNLDGAVEVALAPDWDVEAVLWSSAPSFTIADSVTVRPEQGVSFAYQSAGAVGDGSNPVVNRGTIETGRNLLNNDVYLSGTSVLNEGRLRVFRQSKMLVRGAGLTGSSELTVGDGGVLELFLGSSTTTGLLDVRGGLDLSVTGDSLVLSGGLLGTFLRIVTTTNGVVGNFDSVTPGYELDYRNGTEIWAKLVPEPGTCASLGATIGATLLTRCRRQRYGYR